jgi:hypothetical protein
MRDPTIKIWPASLGPQSVTAMIESPALLGAAPLAGAPQMVVSGNGRWRIVYHNVRFKSANILEARSLLAYLAGRLQPIYVGPLNKIYAPNTRANVAQTLRTYSDGFIFTDGTRYFESTSDCTLSADASADANEIYVTNSVIAPLSKGDYFELNGRLHAIEEIYPNGKWTIWPSLRADYAAGTVLEIDDPRMVARLDPKSQALATEMQYAFTGFATFEFVEERW